MIEHHNEIFVAKILNGFKLFDWVESSCLEGLEILTSLLFPAYKLNRKHTQPERICDIVFEKAKGHGGTLDRTNVHAEAAVQRIHSKSCYEKFRRIHKKTSAPESLF